MVDVGWSAAVDGMADGGVLRQVVLQVHDRLGPANKEDSVVVIQSPHFVWGKQFTAILSSDEFKFSKKLTANKPVGKMRIYHGTKQNKHKKPPFGITSIVQSI